MFGWLLDFRSDTVTTPTLGIRAVMAKTAVTDDVYGEDPTVNALQERIASLVGMEVVRRRRALSGQVIPGRLEQSGAGRKLLAR